MKKDALTSGHYLIVQADFYAELAAAQKQGAVAELETVGASYDIISVPGALEIPAAIAMAATNSCPYDGFIALGCVIRGETTHYETVCTVLGIIDGSWQVVGRMADRLVSCHTVPLEWLKGSFAWVRPLPRVITRRL